MSDFYDCMSEGGFFTADLTEEQFLANQDKAYEMHKAGDKPNYSTGTCESVTEGYGKLDNYGYWEFPLVVNQKSYAIEDHEEKYYV